MGPNTARSPGLPGPSWPIALKDLPALMGVLDDQGVPMEVGISRGGATLLTRATGLLCRQRGECLQMDGPECALCIQLNQLCAARAVSRPGGASRCLSLELVGDDGGTVVTLTGLGSGRELWCVLLESLAGDGLEGE